MIEDDKQPWGAKGLSCEHGTYLTLAIAVVEMARQDVDAGIRMFRTWGTSSTGEVMQRAAKAWRWLADPTVVCHRLSFKEICDGTGTDLTVARAGIDEMAERFPEGFLQHLERVIRVVDTEPPPTERKPRKRKEARGVGAQQEKRRGGANRR